MYSKTVIVGRVGHTPDVKTSQSGVVVAKFNLASSWFNVAKKEESTTWYPCVCFGKTAENVQKYLGKGDLCMVEGRVDISDYEKKDGTKSKRVEVVCERVVFLTPKKEKDDPVMVQSAPLYTDTSAPVAEEDIPF
jgi:single-strand DNA-binding protein